MVQLIVTYTTAEGHVRKRIITDGCTYSEGAADFDLSLNQRAASVVVARMAAMRCVHDSPKDVFAWVDRTLLRVTKRVAQHVLSSSSSSTATATATDSDLFGEVFSEYPRSMYFLRRSNFLQYFNSTPDETAYWRHHLIGQPAQDAHRMFCPALVAYTVDNPEGTAVPLSMDSVSEHSVLVCDAFFYVALFVGSTFASRSNSNSNSSSGGGCYDGNGSCDTTQRSAYDEVLCAVVRRAGAYARETLAGGRSPVPACIECSQNSSNSRFLLCLLDPGSSYSSILSPTLAQAQLSSSSSSSPQLSPLLLSPPLQQQQQKKKSSSIFSLYSLITSYYSGSSSSSSSSSSLSFYSPQRQQQGGVLSSIPSEDISLASFLGYLMRAYPNSD